MRGAMQPKAVWRMRPSRGGYGVRCCDPYFQAYPHRNSLSSFESYPNYWSNIRNCVFPPPLSEGWQRHDFFEALARAVLGGPRPLLLLIDDLQWCDQETVEWLHYLLRLEP